MCVVKSLWSTCRRRRSAVSLAVLLALGGCIGSPAGSRPADANAGDAAATAAGSSTHPPASAPAGDGAILVPHATPRASDRARQFDLDTLPAATITAAGHAIRVWLALTPEQQAEGLMHVPPDEIADDQGMLFVFPDEALRYFWMRNTITPLDIAYARMDGSIVRTWRMPPLTLESFPSVEPAMFALEMKAGAFERLGLAAGVRIDIPLDVFDASP